MTYARTPPSYPRQVATSALLSEFADKIDKDDLDSMRRTIETGCERIDADGW